MSDVKNVITPPAILSYPFIFRKGKPDDKGVAKYSAALIFKADADLKPLQDAALAAAVEKWGTDAAEMLKRGKLRSPFRTDVEAKDYDKVGGVVFISARSDQQPTVVSRVKGADGKPLEITDEKDLYPGCVVRASLRAFAYDRGGNRGVSFGLGNIQKVDDGTRLDSRKDARDEFPADLSGGVGDSSDPFAQ